MCIDLALLQPDAGYFDVLAQCALHKRQVGVGQAQRGDVPAQHFGTRIQRGLQPVFGLAAAVAKGLQRQPFEARTGGQVDLGVL